jgi:hypothetical protein
LKGSKIQDLHSWDSWKVHNFNNSYQNKILLLDSVQGIEENDFFPKLIRQRTKPNIDIISKLNLTDDIKNADFALVPHRWIDIMYDTNYLKYLNSVAKNIPLFIVNNGDVSPRCDLPNTIELRAFLHPWESCFRKIVFPWPIIPRNFSIRGWKPVPRITFMGYVPRLGPGSLLSHNLRSITKPIRSSTYVNRKVTIVRLNKMKKKFNVEIVQRSSFSALNSNLSWEIISNEYDALLSKSDYVLCPRGFGNSTARLYEVISSGATPILIESGSELPKVHTTSFWDENVLRVNLFSNWRRAIMEDWTKLEKNGTYSKRQIRSNEIFNSELEINVYLMKLFSKYLK